MSERSEARWRSVVASAGLFAGPAAWLFNFQLNYALAPWICESGMQVVPAIAAVSILLALAGGAFSLRAWKHGDGEPTPEGAGGHPNRLLGAVGVAMALLFALVILTQGAAGLVFDGCER
ncbi:MAG TPA: hypothetical protein VHG92_04490 [Afifellaceae bacterium]|nr:hypothetical protein [Afifellaceae bacterium]